MSTAHGRISVIIPAYNQEAFIADALASLCRQRLAGWELEVIVVDDASTDQTVALVEGYRGTLPGLKVIRLETNAGVSAARNAAQAQVTGEFYTYLDPDDWYSPDHLATLANALRELEVDFVRCDHVRVTGTSRSIHRAPQALRHRVLDPKDDINPIDAPSMVDYPYSWAGMYRTALMRERGLDRFDESLASAEDRPWIWNLALRNTSYAVVSSASVFYRRGLAQSLTQVVDERQLSFIPSFRQVLDAVAIRPDAAAYLPKALRQFFAITCHHEKRSSRYPAAVRTSMREGLREVFATLDPAAAREVALGMDAGRRKHILSYLRTAKSGASA